MAEGNDVEQAWDKPKAVGSGSKFFVGIGFFVATRAGVRAGSEELASGMG
jgi:hypothetical protein